MARSTGSTCGGPTEPRWSTTTSAAPWRRSPWTATPRTSSRRATPSDAPKGSAALGSLLADRPATEATTVVPAFVINLPRSTDRRRHVERQLRRAGLESEFVPAVDGRVLQPEETRRLVDPSML